MRWAEMQQQCQESSYAKPPTAHSLRVMRCSRPAVPQWVPADSKCNLPIMQEQLDLEMTEKERLEDLLHDERTQKQKYQEKLDGLQKDADDQLAAQKGAYEQRMAQLQQELQAMQGHKVGHGTVVTADVSARTGSPAVAAAQAGWCDKVRPGTRASSSMWWGFLMHMSQLPADLVRSVSAEGGWAEMSRLLQAYAMSAAGMHSPEEQRHWNHCLWLLLQGPKGSATTDNSQQLASSLYHLGRLIADRAISPQQLADMFRVSPSAESGSHDGKAADTGEAASGGHSAGGCCMTASAQCRNDLRLVWLGQPSFPRAAQLLSMTLEAAARLSASACLCMFACPHMKHPNILSCCAGGPQLTEQPWLGSKQRKVPPPPEGPEAVHKWTPGSPFSGTVDKMAFQPCSCAAPSQQPCSGAMLPLLLAADCRVLEQPPREVHCLHCCLLGSLTALHCTAACLGPLRHCTAPAQPPAGATPSLLE